MKYDDASWHYGGDFPQDLPNEAGATHAGMFFVWALLHDLGGSLHVHDSPDDYAKLKSREFTPGEFFLRNCDGKLTDEDFNADGNGFAASYFDLESGAYIRDYMEILTKGLPSVYHVPDTWDSYDRLSPAINTAYEEWRKTSRISR